MDVTVSVDVSVAVSAVSAVSAVTVPSGSNGSGAAAFTFALIRCSRRISLVERPVEKR